MPRKPMIALLAACLSFLAASVARADELAFPDTDPGRHARAFFPAFNAGEAAMKEFWTTHGSANALQQRPVEARLGVWRDMHGDLGGLTPRKVASEGPDFIEVLAHGESGRDVSIRFVCEPDPPHGLVMLRVEDQEGAPGAPPEPTGPPPTDEQIVAALTAEADSLAAAKAFSGTILLDKGGKALFSRSYGMADRAAGTPNRADTRYNLGSINKIFTHTAITQLAQAGKLELDDTIDRYLPDYPTESAKKITIRMLLDHRSGVPDVLTNRKVWDDPAKVRTLADWYALIRDMPLNFEPGTRNQYSNGGFVLLGAIIAKVSGEDYYDYIRRHIYEPAGMTRSDHYASDQQVEGMAKSYTHERPDGTQGEPGGGELPLYEAIRLGRGSPAGGGYSTAGDLLRFVDAIRGKKLFDYDRAEGLLHGPPQLGIAGGSPGVNAMLESSGPYTLVVLANFDPPAAERFAKTVGRMMRRAAGPGDGKQIIRGGPGGR